MTLIHKIQLFFCKYFTSYTPAYIAYIDVKNDYVECELKSGERISIHKGQWVFKKILQKVLLSKFGGTYFMYQPITEEEYNYLTK